MMAARILFRCDAGMQLGSGHVMRCLTLADALAERGAAVTFACSAESYETVPALGASGYAMITLDAPLDAEEIASAGACWDAAVVDHYRLDAAYEGALRRVAPVILAIDDLADRPHDCDILLDQTLSREASDYAPLVPPAAELLLGPEYALLRPEFARARPAALAARAKGGPVRRILVSLGMTDIGGITARAVKAALAAGLEAEIAVAVGSRAESLPELRALAKIDLRVVLHVDCADIWALFAESDLSIGACGTTSWERCCLGLPSIALVLADNQAKIGDELAKFGAVRLLPVRELETAGRMLRDLATNAAERVAMSHSAAMICDGTGAESVAATFAEGMTQVRKNSA